MNQQMAIMLRAVCFGLGFLFCAQVEARPVHLPEEALMQGGAPQSLAQPVQMRRAQDQDSRRYDTPLPDIHEDVKEGACAEKIRKMFPAVGLPASALILDQARVDHRERTVIIPLNERREEMQAVWFDTDSLTEALEAIRLLRAGKIGAMRVTPLAHRPSMLYMFRGVSKEDREACRPERILELLGKCTECEVLEWLAIKP